MKAYAIVLIACGSAAIAIVVLCCLCMGGRQRKRPTVERSVARPSARGMERGQNSQNVGPKDGEMVIFAGAGAAIATTSVVTASSGDDGGGGSGDDGGGCGAAVAVVDENSCSTGLLPAREV